MVAAACRRRVRCVLRDRSQTIAARHLVRVRVRVGVGVRERVGVKERVRVRVRVRVKASP